MIKVLVVDDSFIMRALMVDVVKSDPAIEVCGEAANGEQLLQLVQADDPDVILLDIEMPKMDGIEAMKRLRLMSQAKVIVVSSVAQIGSPQALEARSLGAVAVIPKPSGTLSLDIADKRGHEILLAIHAAMTPTA